MAARSTGPRIASVRLQHFRKSQVRLVLSDLASGRLPVLVRVGLGRRPVRRPTMLESPAFVVALGPVRDERLPVACQAASSQLRVELLQCSRSELGDRDVAKSRADGLVSELPIAIKYGFVGVVNVEPFA